MYNFVFDVDGTLTDSRSTMDPEFKAWFMAWAKHKPVWLITGSDYPKTLEQVGADLCEWVTGVWNCAGNQLTRQGVRDYSREWALTEEQLGFLRGLVAASPWPIKTGQHIEERGSLVNLSTLGRAANHEQRLLYSAWDRNHQERRKLAVLIETAFPELSATVAGETGIDIYPRGWDKSQVAEDLGQFVFFGDKMQQGGNDHTLSLRAHRAHPVDGWRTTWQILREQYDTQDVDDSSS